MNALFWAAAFLAASLPWRSAAICGLVGQWPWQGAWGKQKPLWLTVLESWVLYMVVFGIMFAAEAQQGQINQQSWQFWVIALCMWLVLMFPAAAWFKLRKA